MQQFSRITSACILTLLLTVITLTGCVTTARHPALQNADLPPLIPLDDFFDQSEVRHSYKISPDGRKIAWLAEHQKNINVHVKTIGEDTVHIINTHSWCNINWFHWAQDSRHILYVLSAGSNRADHMYIADTRNPEAEARNLTPDAKWYAWLETISPADPQNILVAQNKRCKHCFDIYKINLETGRNRLLARSYKDVLQWVVDLKGNARGRILVTSDNRQELQFGEPKVYKWKPVKSWGLLDDITVIGLTPDEKGLWLLSNHQRDRISLVRLDLQTRTETLICEDPVADIESVGISTITGKPLVAYASPDYPKTYILDPQLEQDLAVFHDLTPHGLHILSMDDKEEQLTVRIMSDRNTRFYLFNRKTKHKKLLGTSRQPADSAKLAKTKPVRFKSRDGLPLNGYLTLPHGIRARWRPMLPTVLLVHGGPWARDQWEPDRMVQFLANRGYAVLQINYRGSTGYGRTLLEAAKGEFAQAMHNDLIDAVNWAVAQKIADPDAIAIVGGSYGGYAAMAGLTFTPDVFTCGIAINGVASWVDFLKQFPDDIPLYRRYGIERWYAYLGNPADEGVTEDIKRRSPLYAAAKATKPLLVIYGEQDRTVRAEQSEKMIAALRKHGKPVESRKFDNEGHGIHWIHNSKILFQEVAHFLSKHLGGRW